MTHPRNPYHRRTSAPAQTVALALFGIPTISRAAEPMSPFGIGACNQTSQELEQWITQMEKIGPA